MPESPLSTPLLWAVRVLSLAAAGVCAYLWLTGAAGAPVVGCDYWSTFDCDAALTSPWAKWFGLPVAALGALLYLMVFVASWLVPRTSAGWRLLEGATPAALAAAFWFVGVQAMALGSFCLWCLVAHGCGVLSVLAAMALRAAASRSTGPAPLMAVPGLTAPLPSSQSMEGPPGLGLPTLAGIIGAVALVVGQLMTPAPAPVVVEADALTEPLELVVPKRSEAVPTPVAETPETPDRPTGITGAPRPAGSKKVSFLNNALTVDVYDHPMLGAPTAEHFVLELMDYACPHCREFHDKLSTAIERYDGRVAVLVMPVPGEILCNPYVTVAKPKSRGACRAAQVALATASVDPLAFPAVHRWLLEGDRVPNYTSALLEAQKHVDPERLSAAVRDDSGELAGRLKSYVELMASLYKVGKIGLPTQVFQKRLISGPPENVEALYELWEKEFGVEPTSQKAQLPF